MRETVWEPMRGAHVADRDVAHASFIAEDRAGAARLPTRVPMRHPKRQPMREPVRDPVREFMR